MQYLALHEKAKRIVKDYNKCVASLIDVLQELDRLKAYKDFECSSLFDYTVKILKLSQDVSLNLIRIARVSVKVPELKSKIKSGDISISNARKVASVITPENSKHWITLAINLPQQKLEKEIAKVAPKAIVPDQVKILSEDYVELRTTLSVKVLQKLKRARDLESQRQAKAADYDAVLNLALELYLDLRDPVRKAERVEKKKFEIEIRQKKTQEKTGSELKAATQASIPAVTQSAAERVVLRPVRSPIPAAVKNAVLLRDRGRCAYIDRDGKRCDRERWIHTHHVVPVSKGGGNDALNLMTLCSHHHELVHQLSLL